MREIIMAGLVSLFATGALAESAVDTGAISGAADPGVQIVVTGLGDNHQVIGEVGRRDGTYQVERLRPGRYLIKEEGPHHAAREVVVFAGKIAQVDLAARR